MVSPANKTMRGNNYKMVNFIAAAAAAESAQQIHHCISALNAVALLHMLEYKT